MEQVPGSDLKTILVVDDDPHIVAVVIRLLANSDYNIITAESGSKALEESRAFKGSQHQNVNEMRNREPVQETSQG
jgi:CheY-like chemotaxis protein